MGLQPLVLTDRAKMVALLRMIPFVERNHNLLNLGLEEPARVTFEYRVSLFRTNDSITQFWSQPGEARRVWGEPFDLVAIS